MRVTIVPEDRYIQVDGRGLNFDFSADPNIHALQWFDDYGTVEQKTGGSRPATLADVQPFIDAWEVERERIDNPPPPPVPTLAEAKANAERVIDAAASAARGRFISSGVGQDGVYVVKGQQAEAYAAAGYTGPVPSYIAAEAQALGITAQEAAQRMLAVRDAWNTTLGPTIEAQRIGGKAQVRAAPTVEALAVKLAEVLAGLQAIQP